MTTRTTFLEAVLVSGKDPEPGVAFAAPPAEACRESRHGERLDIAQGGHPRERGDDQRAESDERCGAEARTPATESAPDDLPGPEDAQRAADRAADRFVPFAEP